MSNEVGLIGREMDASKKILLAMWSLVFDFELFICGHIEYRGLGGHLTLNHPRWGEGRIPAR